MDPTSWIVALLTKVGYMYVCVQPPDIEIPKFVLCSSYLVEFTLNLNSMIELCI